MPDIAMCAGERMFRTVKDWNGIPVDVEAVICPLRESCWRYTAPPNGRRQTYIFPPFKGDKCSHYWEISDE